MHGAHHFQGSMPAEASCYALNEKLSKRLSLSLLERKIKDWDFPPNFIVILVYY